MTEQQATDREDTQNYELDKPVKSGPVKKRRTVVSVSFPSRTFQAVSEAADEAGVSTSQFIREAAIAKASPVYAEVVVSWAGSSAPVVAPLDLSSSTLAQTAFEPRIIKCTLDGEAFLLTPASLVH